MNARIVETSDVLCQFIAGWRGTIANDVLLAEVRRVARRLNVSPERVRRAVGELRQQWLAEYGPRMLLG